jgi:2-oxoglutarate ferredoxin oxidoreductase subunit gamma
MSKTKVLIAGHGGQGILLLGDYIAYAAMLEGKHVAYIPSYGPETRGGRAKCYVIVSDEDVDNPIADEPDVELIMNQPSMDFVNNLRPGGLVIYNESLIDTGIDRGDIEKLGIPATEIADKLKQDLPAGQMQDTKMCANSVMFGAFLQLCASDVKDDRVKEALKYFLAGKKQTLIPLNYAAIMKGREFARVHPASGSKGVINFPLHTQPGHEADCYPHQ